LVWGARAQVKDPMIILAPTGRAPANPIGAADHVQHRDE
jgi:hypothetical protein